jgi:hypothetical protein
MNYKIDELTLEELNIIALAVDYFLCNYEHSNVDLEQIENLFLHLDLTAEAAEEAQPDQRIVEKTDNLLVVDFRPKNG